MLTRYENWHNDLHAYLQPHMRDPQSFAYGVLDCCLFVTGAIEAMTGVDLAGPFRGTYDDRISALKAMGDFCGSCDLVSFVQKIADENQLQAIHAAFAQRGDLVIANVGDGGEAVLMIVGLTGAELIGVGTGGLITLPTHDAEGILRARHAWAIGVRACPVPAPAKS